MTQPYDNERVTPLVKLALRHLSHAFFYLHPFPFTFRISEKNLIIIERCGLWKLIPYCTYLIILGVVSVGSCAYVTSSYIFGTTMYAESTNKPSLFQALLSLVMGSLELLRIGLEHILHRYSQVMPSYNAFLELEQICKQTKIC